MGFKKLFYRLAGQATYLSLTQQFYRLSYRLGLLRSDPQYAWHYFVKNLVDPNDVVIDLGANLGYFATAFLEVLSAEGRLYCVEPVVPYQRLLQRLLKNTPQATLLPFALGAENEATIRLGMPAAFSHLGYLRHGIVTVETETRSLTDSYTFTSSLRKGSEVFSHLKRLDYIKCDIEGHETVVLPEIQALIEQLQPLVQLETWGEQLPQMLDFFEQLQFRPYYLEKGLLFAYERGRPLPPTTDLLFVPASRRGRIQPFVANEADLWWPAPISSLP